MKKVASLLFISLWTLGISCTHSTSQVAASLMDPTSPPPPFRKLSTIAFGSCNHQDKDQNHWAIIQKQNPDLWIWGGDMVYSDTGDRAEMREIFKKQKYHPEYASFARNTPIIGTWDDHDYYDNNSDATAPSKDLAQKVVLDFLDEPKDSLRRQREGIYEYYQFESDLGKIHIYLLDVRYHKSPWGTENGTMLGAKQWSWLEAGLQSTAGSGIHIFVSGLQVIPIDHPFEAWGRFPHEREKLISLFKSYKVKQPIILSGDRHIGEISHLPQAESGVEGGVYELTSSGLTHSYEASKQEVNRYRLRDNFYQFKNFGILELKKLSNELSLQILNNQGQIVKNQNLIIL